jgi:hypothetical protein
MSLLPILNRVPLTLPWHMGLLPIFNRVQRTLPGYMDLLPILTGFWLRNIFFLCRVLYTIVYLFVHFHLVIVLFVLIRFTASDSHFDILDLRLLIITLIS